MTDEQMDNNKDNNAVNSQEQTTQVLLTKILQNMLEQQKHSAKEEPKSILIRFLLKVFYGTSAVLKAIPTIVWIGIFIFIVVISMDKTSGETAPHVAMINVKGVIGGGKGGVISDDFIDSLNKAFDNKEVEGVVLYIDSPGGSPVQAATIYDEIMKMKEKAKNDKRKFPIYSVIGDVGASAAYYIASASDKIFANRASTVGSIGVIMQGYDVSELMEKVGIKRRTHIAGLYKDIGDMSRPETKFEKEFLEDFISRIRDLFIKDVKKGRGDRLKVDKSNEELLFSGLFWDGVAAKELGLIDGLANANDVVKMIKQVFY